MIFAAFETFVRWNLRRSCCICFLASMKKHRPLKLAISSKELALF